MIERQTVVILSDATKTWAAVPVHDGTATADYPQFFSSNGCKGGVFHIGLDANASTSLTFTIKHWDQLQSAVGSTILASAAKTSDTNFELVVFPGVTAATNAAVAMVLPEYWTLDITGTTDTAKFTVAVDLIP